MSVQCPVCRAATVVPLMEVEARCYFACETCQARFLDPKQLPAREDEYAHYLSHENEVDDPRYRAFLSKLATPLMAKLRPGMHGLDFGCGPGPALAHMLREAGFDVELYDPFFFPDRAVLSERYDFISCTEVVEHCHAPADVFDCFDRMLKPGGWLGVMTCFQTDDARFANWHYRKDPTHVVFYRAATFEVIAAQRGWSCEVVEKDVVLMGACDDE